MTKYFVPSKKDKMDYFDAIFNVLAFKSWNTLDAGGNPSISNGKRQQADGNGPHAWTTGIDKQSRPHVVSFC
jgi:hypothetical protein